MIADVHWYRMNGSISAGEYPLFASGQSLSSFEIATSPRAKYADGMQISIDVPYFPGIDTVNVAEIAGKYYWVTAYHQRTAEANQYSMTLDYMGPTTEYRAGSTAKGSWHKLPYLACPYLKDEVTNGIQQIIDSKMFSDLQLPPSYIEPPYQIDTYLVQVTGTVPNTNNIVQYIFLIGYSTAESRMVNTSIRIDANSPMPSFYYLFSNITELTGLPEDNILDVSISARSPWEWTATLYQSQGGTGSYYISTTETTLDLVKCGGNNPYYMYRTIYGGHQRESYNQWIFDAPIPAVGTVGLRDWSGNIVMDIPTSSMDIGNTGSGGITATAVSLSDISGLYFGLQIGDQRILIPEGKLPWLGSTWETYKAYDMSIDRQAMTQAIEYARMQKQTAQTSGVVNGAINAISTGVMTGVLAGGPAGAAMGIASGIASTAVNYWEADRAYELSELQARNAQQLTEKRAQSQPQTGYQTGYGAIYCYQNTICPLAVVATVPKTNVRLINSYYADWTRQYGYPAEGIIDAEIQTGYYQGSLIERPGGMFADRTNEIFMRGFRFVDP